MKWGRWGGKIGVRKKFVFPKVGKIIKISLPYFSLPFLLNFAIFSVESSLPFYSLLFFAFFSLSLFLFPCLLPFPLLPHLISSLSVWAFPYPFYYFLFHFPLTILHLRYSSFSFSSVNYNPHLKSRMK